MDCLAVVLVFCVLMIIPAGVTKLDSADARDFASLTGTVSVLQVRGPSDAVDHPVWVWRPPGADSADIPVVYLLHGYPGTAADAFNSGLAVLLDERLREGYEPFVVACPDGNGEHHSDTEWADSWNGNDQVMSRVLESVIPAVEGSYPRPAALRVLAGFSMGGYGAMNTVMQHREVFGSVVSIDGYFVINDLSDMFGDIPSVEQRNDPSVHPQWARGMHVILEEDADDPLSLVRGQAAWMGGLLSRAGVPAIVRISPGTHSWAYALRALTDSLTYLDGYWQTYAETSLHRRPRDGGPVLRRVGVHAVLEQLVDPGASRGDLAGGQVPGEFNGQRRAIDQQSLQLPEHLDGPAGQRPAPPLPQHGPQLVVLGETHAMVAPVQVPVRDGEQVPDLAVRVVDHGVEHRHLAQPRVVGAPCERDQVDGRIRLDPQLAHARPVRPVPHHGRRHDVPPGGSRYGVGGHLAPRQGPGGKVP
jgi:S-formylglutathione hydrolase FrmB